MYKRISWAPKKKIRKAKAGIKMLLARDAKCNRKVMSTHSRLLHIKKRLSKLCPEKWSTH